MDIRIGANNDVIFESGKSQVTEDLSEALAQRLRIRLQTFKGEWFLDTEYGTPWLQEILGKKVDKNLVDLSVQTQILSDVLTHSIVSFESNISSDRVYSVSFVVKAVDGSTTETIDLTI